MTPGPCLPVRRGPLCPAQAKGGTHGARSRPTQHPPGCGGPLVIGASALAGHEIDGAVNIYAGIYANPFLIWGRWRKKLLGAALPISFQFHHTQMDGADGARFLDRLQAEIDRLGRG